MDENTDIWRVFWRFYGNHDSWETGNRSATNPMNKQQVLDLFHGFEL